MAGAQASLSSLLSESAKKWAAKDIAAKESKEKGKEGIFGGLMSLLKPVAGFASKALMTALGIGSGGLLTPLLIGLGTSGFSKFGSSILRGLGLGADPSKVKTDSKYGYGEKAAETISQGLQEGIKKRDAFSTESILSDIASSYISELTPKIVPKTEVIDGKTVQTWGVKGGDLLKAQKGKGFKDILSKERLFDLDLDKGIGKALLPTMDKAELSTLAKKFSKDPSSILEAITAGSSAEAGLVSGRPEDINFLTMPSEEVYSALDPILTDAQVYPKDRVNVHEWQEAFLPTLSAQEALSPPQTDYLSQISQVEAPFGGQDISTVLEGFTGTQDVPLPSGYRPPSLKEMYWGGDTPTEEILSTEPTGFGYRQGGKVPEYQDGGTITDYFNKKGLSLGGSNKKSLAAMLGKI